MKFFNLLIIAFVVAFAAPALGKTFTRCSLARQMYALGVPKSELARWTCIAKYESHYQTNIVGPPNRDGTKDYGLFQINDRYWCQPSSGHFSYNQCKVGCDNLLNDNIGVSVRCARLVKAQQGWPAWSTWKYCSGNLPSINDCF
ncbi:lysozyme 1-like [Calliphora vicina]|uniref:lysozyme 1-like n=1 Tax=Calliphora vicina TaxID=7373 RepID=UPI00325B95F6